VCGKNYFGISTERENERERDTIISSTSLILVEKEEKVLVVQKKCG
jgi:hypothetical protein